MRGTRARSGRVLYYLSQPVVRVVKWREFDLG